MSTLSRRARIISPSPTLAISAKAKQMKADGIDVIGFGAGEPDFDTPAHIKEAAIEALRAGMTKYTPASGTAELKKAICKKLLDDNGLEFDPSGIIISCGAKHSLYNAVQVLCQEGDEVIIPSPYWVTYPEQVKLAGAKPVIIRTTEETCFKITPSMFEEKITPKTKLLILNSPSNPTGAVYHRDELEDLARVIEARGIHVLSDEIYEKVIYDGVEHVSIASLGEAMKRLTIVINGVSKAYSMTGWRIGYAAGDKEIIAAMGKLQSHSTSNPTTFAQKASVTAISGPQECVAGMVAEFDKRREYMADRVKKIKGMACIMPEGAFYLFPNISSLYGKKFNGAAVEGSDSFAAVILDDIKVAVVPGSGFGADECIRLSYATSMDNIERGLDRIEEFVSKLS